jgi:hypothetical protein
MLNRGEEILLNAAGGADDEGVERGAGGSRRASGLVLVLAAARRLAVRVVCAETRGSPAQLAHPSTSRGLPQGQARHGARSHSRRILSPRDEEEFLVVVW